MHHPVHRTFVRAFTIIMLALASACSGGEEQPTLSLTSQRIDGACQVEIDFPVGAMQLYVSDPNLTVPRANLTPSDGALYFGIEATVFPDGFAGPVTYGTPAPEGGKLAMPPQNMHNTGNAYPLPLVGASDGELSLSTVRTGCGPGTGGCFKVGLVTLPGNHELVIDDFTCEDTERTWETFD